MIVPGGDDDAARLEHGMCTLLEEVPELVIERFVHLVQEKDRGIQFFGDRESQPGFHPLRVGKNRMLECLRETAPGLDLVQADVLVEADAALGEGVLR